MNPFSRGTDVLVVRAGPAGGAGAGELPRHGGARRLLGGDGGRLRFAGLVARGGAVEGRTRLDGLQQDDGGVTATLVGDGGEGRRLRAGWLVGCDGAHSTVRHRLGLPFRGASYDEQFVLADVR